MTLLRDCIQHGVIHMIAKTKGVDVGADGVAEHYSQNWDDLCDGCQALCADSISEEKDAPDALCMTCTSASCMGTVFSMTAAFIAVMAAEYCCLWIVLQYIYPVSQLF